MTRAARAGRRLLAGSLAAVALVLGGCAGSGGGSGDTPVDQIDRARDVGDDVEQRQSDLEQRVRGEG